MDKKDKKFKKGDVVKLKSGSPDLTIVDYVLQGERLEYQEPDDTPLQLTGEVLCIWFEKDTKRQKKFHQDLLTLA